MREQRHHEADHPVGADLDQQAGQHQAAGGRRLGVGVGQPGVQWHRRQLDGEGGEEAQHEPGRRRERKVRAQQLQVVEGIDAGLAAVDDVQGEDGDQHEQAADLGEQEELDGGVDAALVSPDGDQEVHGDEHHLEEEVEEEQVEGGEHADQGGDRPEQHEVEEADALGDLAPRGEHGQQPERIAEGDHEQAEAVGGQEEADAELRYPGDVDTGHERTVAGEREVGRLQDPLDDHGDEAGGHGEGRDPAGGLGPPPADDPGGDAGDEGPGEQRDQDHRPTISRALTALIAAPPAARRPRRPSRSRTHTNARARSGWR